MNFDNDLREKLLKDLLNNGIKVYAMHYFGMVLAHYPKEYNRINGKSVYLDDDDTLNSFKDTYVDYDFSIKNNDGDIVGKLTSQEALLLYSFHNLSSTEELAFSEIMYRRGIINKYGSEEKACEALKASLDDDTITEVGKESVRYKLGLVDGTIFKGSQERLAESIDQSYNLYINCGGYALEIFGCVFGGMQKDTERVVLTLLDEYKFIRLLGDSKIQSDEYMVIFKKGHHFIKVNDDRYYFRKR
jgi:hypothetical protein